ncbi:MAG TPA: trypsin-like peptidase domain-containing protein [Acidimicrobiales bacterium]|nr:trypsin-like peptidase domain-containing protein [Acidimicrobiales bacterium]
MLPTVVTISASRGQSGGTGSGEVIRSDGYILTNNHVIAVAANGGAVEVTFSDGESLPATVVGRDPQTDLAVLHVTGRKAPKVISLGSSTSLRVGQPVVALGAPLGLSSTVTTGIVSALGRTIQVPAEGDQLALLVDAVQTDAAINPGNSGGALVDCSGRLVGVPTAGATVPSPSGQPSAGNIGIGFAIPVNLATLVADEIITTGSVSHAYFGFQAVPISPALAARSGVTEGLYVSQVAAGGPADNAGLQAGDVISAIDGQPARSVDQLVALTLTKRAGDKVALTYRRQGRSATTTVTLATQP